MNVPCPIIIGESCKHPFPATSPSYKAFQSSFLGTLFLFIRNAAWICFFTPKDRTCNKSYGSKSWSILDKMHGSRSVKTNRDLKPASLFFRNIYILQSAPGGGEKNDSRWLREKMKKEGKEKWKKEKSKFLCSNRQ